MACCCEAWSAILPSEPSARTLAMSAGLPLESAMPSLTGEQASYRRGIAVDHGQRGSLALRGVPAQARQFGDAGQSGGTLARGWPG